MQPRFYLKSIPQSADTVTINDKPTIHQITTVLRLKKNDLVTVFSATKELELVLKTIEKHAVVATVLTEKNTNRDPEIQLTLYISLLKKDKFEWVLQKGVELGVQTFIPIITDHAVARTISKNKLVRYHAIIKEATEQCGGQQIADLNEPISLAQALTNLQQKNGVKIIAWEGENQQHLIDYNSSAKKEFHLFIGPEGGFTAQEVAQAQEVGCICVSLGKRILRAETAAIVGSALLLLR